MPATKPRRKQKQKSKHPLLDSSTPWTPEERARHYQTEAERSFARAEAYREAMLILTHQVATSASTNSTPRPL